MNSWAKSQHSNGGFPYWPSDTLYENYYVSLRIAHIYASAVRHGIKESDIKINKDSLLRYLRNNYDTYRSNYTKAYACYVHALFDNTGLDSALNTLYENMNAYNLSTIAYIGLAYAEKGNLDKAKKVAELIKNYLQPSQRSVSITEKNRTSMWDWFESDSAQFANILQLLVTLNPDDGMVDRLIFTLLQDQSKGYWQNTATTSKVLEAIAAYIDQRDLTSTDYTATATLNKKQLMSENFKGAAAKPKTLHLPFEDEFISKLPQDKAVPFTFEKNGTGRLFYTVEMKYAIPDELQTAFDQGLKVQYEISDYESGEVVNNIPDTDAVVTLESGKIYKAKVTLSSTRRRDYVAMRCPIPSGAEILDSTFVTTGSAGTGSSTSETGYYWRSYDISNKTIYDNEVQFFWDTFYSGQTTVTFTFRAGRRGVYPTPPIQSECMYEPEIFGRSDGYLFVIK